MSLLTDVGANDRTSSVKCTDGKSYDVTSDLLKIASVTVTEHGELLRSQPFGIEKLTVQSENSSPTSLNLHSVSVESSTRYSNTATGLENRIKPEESFLSLLSSLLSSV